MSVDVTTPYQEYTHVGVPRIPTDATDERRWTVVELLLCWQCTTSLTRNARNNLIWNLGFQALGLFTVVGTVAFGGELMASDIATIINVAIAVPLLSLLAQALRRQSSSHLRALNRWVVAVTLGYCVATMLDIVGAARWGAACLAHAGSPPEPPAPPAPPHHPGYPAHHGPLQHHAAVWGLPRPR